MTAAPYDVIVVGAGIAGLTAANELARKGLRIANIESSMFGGLVINVNELEGAVPGSGADFASTLMMELADAGAESVNASVTALAPAGELLRVETDQGTYLGRTVIAASGARLRHLGVPGEQEFEHRGVSHCADCDGPMCQGQDVVVVGGGDSALQSAVVLAQYARTVVLLNRDAAFSARPHFVDAVRGCQNIEVRHGTQVTAIVGDEAVRAVRARAGDAEFEIPCSSVFAYVGLEPVSEWLADVAELDAQGAVKTNEQLQTRVPRLYAIGAVRAGYRGTLADAIADARAAAQAVLRQLAMA